MTPLGTPPRTPDERDPQESPGCLGGLLRNEWSYMFLEHTEQMIKVTGQQPAVWPAIEALERSPNISADKILPQENWKLTIENAKRKISRLRLPDKGAIEPPGDDLFCLFRPAARNLLS